MDFAFFPVSQIFSLSLLRSSPSLVKRFFSLVALLLLLSACGENKPDLPTEEFSKDYILADFNLDEDYDYWEVRLGRPWETGDSAVEVLYQYDDDAYAGLDSTQLQVLSDTKSDNGISYGCYPSGCNFYVIALLGYSPVIVDSVVDLNEFLGEIDTEAELWVRLDYASDYHEITTPESFEEVPGGGYRAVISWNNTGGTRGRDLVTVSPDGSIEKITELERGSSPPN